MLTSEQIEFLDAEGNIILKACPGSGKTFIVSQKIVKYITNWSSPHQGVAVLSFTNVASEEIQKQAKKNNSDSFFVGYPHYNGTLDSFINKFIFLRFGYLLLDISCRPTIAIKDIYKIPFVWDSKCHINCVNNISSIRWGIDKKSLSGMKNYDICSGKDFELAPCYKYKKILLKKGIVFQNEVAALTCSLLENYPEIAEAIALRFPIIILDEAQDTSKEQMKVLDLINKAGTKSMFLVGDPDQSIYEWRNAMPECFISKMNNKDWTTLSLSVNFRSSQLICNATQQFAHSLEKKQPNEARGKFADFEEKPKLILYDKDNNSYKDQIVEYFTQLCKSINIEINFTNIAIVTRKKINLYVKDLWQNSEETEFFAQASYELFIGLRKKAYELCEKALFSILIKDYKNIETSIEHEIKNKMSYNDWQTIVIDMLSNLPNVNLELENWIKQLTLKLNDLQINHNLNFRDKLTLKDFVKIKKTDKNLPDFKKIPLKQYFENKKQTDFTFSSIHGVKGETYDALMLIIEATRGNTLTPTFLNNGEISKELMRLAYVAMTRPRKLLVVAMPKTKVNHTRFPKDIWEHIIL